MAHVNPRQAYQMQQEGALVLDVRDRDEVRRGRIPDSLHIPMTEVPDRIEEIPVDRPVIVQCATGIRSARVAHYLNHHGRDARNLRGGIFAWYHLGLPVV